MILDLQAELISYDGEKISWVKQDSEGKPTETNVTLKNAITSILGGSHRDDEQMAGDQKFQLIEIGYKIINGSDLTAEEITTLKARSGKIATPVIHWAVCKEIERQLSSGSAIVPANELKEG